jgi:GNAT superfamily N-acetyltransferase
MVKPERKMSSHLYTVDFRPVVEFLSYLRIPKGLFPTLYSEPYFQWKIAANPFGESACYLRRQDGVPVAHCSITAKPINPLLGVGSGCGELGDTHTHPSFRKQGHFGALGSHVIQEFPRLKPSSEKLIYGLPNNLALPGWTRRCNCEVFQELGVIELELCTLKAPLAAARIGWDWAVRGIRPMPERFHLCTDDCRTSAEIDRLWSEAREKDAYLLEKDGSWWRWRYGSSTERYLTYAIRERHEDRLQAYVVVKMGWRPLRYVQLCDIFGQTPELIVRAFQLFMQSMVLPTDTVVFWAQTGTELADKAMRQGFVKKRDVPVIFFRNDSYERLRKSGQRIRLALGDSDNA